MNGLENITHAFAVPGASNIIDGQHPLTSRGVYSGETLEQIQVRYPGAEVVELDAWMTEKAARQDAPVEWYEIEESEYYEMFECLPPAYMGAGAFLVGEASDHHATTGRPRFQAYKRNGAQFLRSSRPMTIDEIRKGEIE